MNVFRTSLFVLFLGVLFSCNSDDNGLQEELIGKWAATEELAQQDTYRIDEIEIYDNYTFKRRAAVYGLYEGQTREDVSKWQEYAGLLREYESELIFSVKTSAWFDHKEEDPGPFTSSLAQELFEGPVNYSIANSILTITYISLANDAPVEVVLRYERVN